MNNSSPDAGIPVLTEVIPTPMDADFAPIETAGPAPTPIHDEFLPLQRYPDRETDDARWQRLEREVTERVLRQVIKGVDAMLEQRVRDSLADVLQIAVDSLATDIRDGLHAGIKDLVARIAEDELKKIRSSGI